MSEEPKLVTSSECQQIELWPGVLRRTMCWGDRMLVAEITLAKGADVPAHSHMHEQVGYVARGRLEWTVDGKTAILSAGDGYAIPGNVTHSVRVLEDSVAIDIFSPVREEYKT